jgi:cell division protein FtsW
MKTQVVFLGLCVAALSIFGLVILFSTAYDAADALRFQTQLKWLGAGMVVAPICVWLDYGWLQRRAILYPLGALCLVGLVAVFIPGLGVHINGASRWIRDLGQPSELVKPVTILVLAATLVRVEKFSIQEFGRGYCVCLALGLGPAILIFLEPDWGTAILLGAVTVAMLLVAGARWLHLVVTVAGALTVLPVFALFNPVRWERILVFLNPEAYRHGAGWQVWQSLLAIGSGGLSGQFLDGSLHKFGYVPEQQTDFIFARLGEETGLWGTTLVVVLYAGILWCGLKIARQSRDRFGHFIAVGCTVLIVLQAAINIAVATSLVPNKGLSLPFVSYGGSSLLASFVCAGLVGSVGWRARIGRRSPSTAVQLMLL